MRSQSTPSAHSAPQRRPENQRWPDHGDPADSFSQLRSTTRPLPDAAHIARPRRLSVRVTACLTAVDVVVRHKKVAAPRLALLKVPRQGMRADIPVVTTSIAGPTLPDAVTSIPRVTGKST